MVIIATVSAVCGMLLGSSAAFADEPTDPGPSSTLVVSAGVDEIPEGAVSVEAVLACDEFTGEVLAYAQEHGYCPTPGKGGVTPQAVQTYNCGSAWIYGFNNGIRGRMYVSYGFSSTKAWSSTETSRLGPTSPSGGGTALRCGAPAMTRARGTWG